MNRQPRVDLTGRRFNRLTVIRWTDVRKHNARTWECLCDCGQVVHAVSTVLLKGTLGSCGCFRRERMGQLNKQRTVKTPGFRNGMTAHFPQEYNAWKNAISRCHNSNHKGYHNYGARGIHVHEEWRSPADGFEKFLRHIGPKPSPELSLDRIDNDGGYVPNNLRWATTEQQLSNRRCSKPSA